MIKKNTKVIFKDEDSEHTEELVSGMPLSKGDIVHVHEEDQIINITYVLRKI